MNRVAVVAAQRSARRQIARTLASGGLQLTFLDKLEEVVKNRAKEPPDLLIIDADQMELGALATSFDDLETAYGRPPVVLLSLGERQGPLIDLFQSHELGNLIARNGAVRAATPVLDEQELLVTCQKVLRRDIFGLEKYIGLWGAELQRVTLTSIADKAPFLEKFEDFLRRIDCPQRAAPDILTVAEELILNAMVHAPRDPNGEPKYEQVGPHPDLVLAPNEYVTVGYGCDGQRLMLSVSDNFGSLSKQALYRYLKKGLGDEKKEVDTKPSGAGIGLSMAFATIHQLIFNIKEQHRTEAIAGWNMRAESAAEFRAIGKSLNVFWLPANAKGPEKPSPKPPAPYLRIPRPPTKEMPPSKRLGARVLRLAGMVDESTNLAQVLGFNTIDLKDVRGFTSRGVRGWLDMLAGLAGRPIEVVRCPEALVRLSGEVEGMLEGVTVSTVLCPFSCGLCGSEKLVELPVTALWSPPPQQCVCGQPLASAGSPDEHLAFLEAAGVAS